MPPTWIAYVLLIATAMAWGANAVAGKLAAGHVDPIVLTHLRWGCAALVILPFAWPHLRHDWPRVRQRAGLLFLYGLIGFGAFNIALYSALNYTSAVNVVIEQAGMPGMIFLLSFLFLRQRPVPAQLVGFLMTAAGVAVVVSTGDLTRLLTLSLNRGDALMLVAIVCYSAYAVALRFRPPIHWLSFIAVIAAAAWLATLPVAAWRITADPAGWPDLTGWGVVLFAAVVPGVLAQAAFIRGTELIGANRAGLFINLVPLFGTGFSVLLLGEAFHAFHALALALVLGGIALAERSRGAAG